MSAKKTKRRARPPSRPQQRESGAPVAEPDTGKEEARRSRREEARRYRESIRRKASRRRYLRNAANGLLAVAVVGAIVYGTTRTKHGATLSAQERTLLDQAPFQAEAAGCGPVQTISAYSGASDQAHIGAQVASPPPLSSYPSTPPASGPHDSSPLGAHLYPSPPSIYSAIHSLEHGAAIIWYAPTASGAELDRIKTFFGDPSNRDHVIVAPYSYPDQGAAGRLPAGKEMVLVAWHHIESCARPSLAAAFDFVAHYRFPAPAGESYKGDAPEQGAPI